MKETFLHSHAGATAVPARRRSPALQASLQAIGQSGVSSGVKQAQQTLLNGRRTLLGGRHGWALRRGKQMMRSLNSLCDHRAALCVKRGPAEAAENAELPP